MLHIKWWEWLYYFNFFPYIKAIPITECTSTASDWHLLLLEIFIVSGKPSDMSPHLPSDMPYLQADPSLEHLLGWPWWRELLSPRSPSSWGGLQGWISLWAALRVIPGSELLVGSTGGPTEMALISPSALSCFLPFPRGSKSTPYKLLATDLPLRDPSLWQYPSRMLLILFWVREW